MPAKWMVVQQKIATHFAFEGSASLTPMRVQVGMVQALDTTQEPEMAGHIQVGGQ